MRTYIHKKPYSLLTFESIYPSRETAIASRQASGRYLRPSPRWYEKSPPDWMIGVMIVIALFIGGI